MPALPLNRLRMTGLTVALAVAMAASLGGCMEMGGGGALSPGLTASMATPGANLDRATALSLLNQYRGTTGAGPLAGDPSLDAQAQALAQAYAKNGKAPSAPSGLVGMRASAGYANFAETFSGWRNSPADAAVLANGQARRAGLASVYDASSNYGVYWILVLAG